MFMLSFIRAVLPAKSRVFTLGPAFRSRDILSIPFYFRYLEALWDVPNATPKSLTLVLYLPFFRLGRKQN